MDEPGVVVEGPPLGASSSSGPAPAPWPRLAVLGFLVLLVAVAAFVLDVSFRDVQVQVMAAGVWAPLVYLGLFVVAGSLAVPGTLLLVVGALAFPLEWALGLAWLGSVLGAGAGFVVARLLGRGFVERLLGERAARLDAHVGARGFQVVLLMRLGMFPPFNVLNFAAGLTRVRLLPYLAATGLGIIPYTAVVVLLVARVGAAPGPREIFTDPLLYGALAGVLGVALGSMWLRQRVHVMRRRRTA